MMLQYRAAPPSCQAPDLIRGSALASTSCVTSRRAEFGEPLRKTPPVAGKLVDGRAWPTAVRLVFVDKAHGIDSTGSGTSG
jgi:hypothetical protein